MTSRKRKGITVIQVSDYTEQVSISRSRSFRGGLLPAIFRTIDRRSSPPLNQWFTFRAIVQDFHPPIKKLES
jgi:hypothetical protein